MKIMLRIFLYFMGWGLLYGTMLGALIGTALHPLVVIAAFYGALIGSGCWFVCALIVMPYHAFHFSPDIDLAVYRRRVARATALSVIVLSLLGLILESLAAGFRPESVYFFHRIAGLFLAFSPLIMCISFATAYTARQYPVWLVRQMAIECDPLDLPHQGPQILTERNRLLRHIHHRQIMVLAGFPAAGIQVYWIASNHFLFPCPESALFPYLLFMLIALLFTAYCAQGNALLITFVKVLILEDYFPHLSRHWYRVILTLLSFFYTLVTTWWTLLLAPLYAFFIAYHVYHTLALPDDGYEKAKRKEAASNI